MKYFQKIAEGIDVIPLLNAASRQPKLWNNNPLRQAFPDSPHKEVDDIWLRFTRIGKRSLRAIGNDLEAVPFPAWGALPQAHPIIFSLMQRVQAERLGRVMITKISPGKRILPHKDVLGEYAHYYSRYHIVLQSRPGALFGAEDEVIHMQTGEAWWFDASALHEVVNNSDDDRVHLIIDVRVPR